MRKWSVIVALLLIGATWSKAWSDDGRGVVQKTISSQIEAFLNDDADMAYSFAAPGIQGRFPDKAQFFEMVKRSYQPVFRPGNYAFGRYMELEAGVMAFQEVLITSPDGHDWSAVYKLQHQPDGSWKIGGVSIFPNTKSKGI